MPLVNYEGDSSDEDDERQVSSNPFASEFPEEELEDLVRGENKSYAKDIPQAPKSVKRKRDGPVKIFLPTIEHDSDEDDKPKRKQPTVKRTCALLNSLPPPVYDEDKPTVVTQNSPQTSSTGLFIPYTLNKKQQQQQQKKPPIATTISKEKIDSDVEDDDDDDQTDFLGLTKSNRIEISNNDIESVLRETLPKPRYIPVEQPQILPTPVEQFEDLDEQPATQYDDDDELLRYLPKSERYKEIKTVHIDSMLGEQAKIQLLKNATEERETMKAQAAIVVPKGETKRRAQITYLVAKAQHDDLKLKNMWSEQKLTRRQTQSKYGF